VNGAVTQVASQCGIDKAQAERDVDALMTSTL